MVQRIHIACLFVQFFLNVPTTVEQLFNIWGEDKEKTLEIASIIKSQASLYFEQSKDEVHGYFKYVFLVIAYSQFRGIEPVVNQIEASYFNGKCNHVIHHDLFPWATIVGWGDLDAKAKQNIMATFSINLIGEIQQLQPQIVILGIEDDLAKTLFPELAWQLLHIMVKTGTKVRINKSWAEFKQSQRKRVLFIQSTPAHYLFAFLDNVEKSTVGLLIQQELIQHGIMY